MANTIKLTAPFSKKPSAEKWSQMRDKKELMFAHMDSMLTQAKTGFPCGPYPYYKMGYGWVQVYFNEQEGQHLKAHTVRAMTKTCGHLQDVLCLAPKVVQDPESEDAFEENRPVTVTAFQEETRAPGETDVKLSKYGTFKMKYTDFKSIISKEATNWVQYKKAMENYHKTDAATTLFSMKKRVPQKRKYHKVCVLLLLLLVPCYVYCDLFFSLFVPCLICCCVCALLYLLFVP